MNSEMESNRSINENENSQRESSPHGSALVEVIQNSIFSERNTTSQDQQKGQNTAQRRQVIKDQPEGLAMQNTSFDTLIPDGVPEVAHDSLQLLSPWPTNPQTNFNSGTLHTMSLGSGIPTSQTLLSQELKMLRLRISDYNKSPVIDAICQKIWKLIIVHQYDEILLELISHPSTLPVHIDLYEAITPLLETALGIYFQTNYYVARHETSNKYGSTNVFYPRFMYDLISMFGLNLFYIELPTLEFLIRRVYAAISFRQDNQIKLVSYDNVKPAFTEDEYNKIVNQQLDQRQSSVIHQKTLSIPESKQPGVPVGTDEEEGDGFQLLGDLLTVGKDAADKLRQMKLQKKKLINKMNSEKRQMRPFMFYTPESFIKHDPVKTLATLKRQKIQPLQVGPNEVDGLEKTKAAVNSEDEDATNEMTQMSPKPLRTPIQSLRSIDPEDRPTRHHTLKIYEHIQSFNTVDLDETIDVDEKFKKRQIHEGIMKKLDSRPDQFKLQQFLKYEKLNLKSHLYNQSNKTDKMFRELNAIQYRPKPEDAHPSTHGSTQKSVADESHTLKLYAPIIELKKDELASQNHSLQQMIIHQQAVEQMHQSMQVPMKAPLQQRSQRSPIHNTSSSQWMKIPQPIDTVHGEQKQMSQILESIPSQDGKSRWTPNSNIRISSEVGVQQHSSIVQGHKSKYKRENEVDSKAGSKVNWQKQSDPKTQRPIQESEVSSQDESPKHSMMRSQQKYNSKAPSHRQSGHQIDLQVQGVSKNPTSNHLPQIKLHPTLEQPQATHVTYRPLNQYATEDGPHSVSSIASPTQQHQLDYLKNANLIESSQFSTNSKRNRAYVMQQRSVDHSGHKYEFPYMRPTLVQSMRMEQQSKDLMQQSIQMSEDPGSVGEGKRQVWIHDVTMGDFQLQNWRSVKRKHTMAGRNYVKAMAQTIQ